MVITSVTRKKARPMLAHKDKEITVVEAEFDHDGRTRHMILSQWADETEWFFDYVSPGPDSKWFSHGIGSRECRKSIAQGVLLTAIREALK